MNTVAHPYSSSNNIDRTSYILLGKDARSSWLCNYWSASCIFSPLARLSLTGTSYMSYMCLQRRVCELLVWGNEWEWEIYHYYDVNNSNAAPSPSIPPPPPYCPHLAVPSPSPSRAMNVIKQDHTCSNMFQKPQFMQKKLNINQFLVKCRKWVSWKRERERERECAPSEEVVRVNDMKVSLSV